MIPWYLIVLAVSVTLPLAVKFVTLWLVAPVVIRNKQRMPIEPHLIPAAAEHFTPEMRDSLHALIPQFRAEGFGEPAGICHLNGAPGISAVQTTMINRATGDVVVIITTRAQSTRSTVMGVRSEFPNGRSVVTYVNPKLGVFPRNPDADSENVPWVRDGRTLCEVHRRRLARLGNSQTARVTPPPGDEIGYATREWHREFARHVRNGYYVADTAAGVYRHTWKGAFLCTWKLLQPIKGLRVRLRDRRAGRLWRELGMGAWTPPPITGPATTVPVTAAAAVADDVAGPTAPPPPLPIAPEEPGPLRYETGLADGEIGFESAGHALTVRMGRPSVGRYLLGRWPTLLAIGAWALLLSFNFYMYWRVQAVIARVGGPVRPTWSNLSTLVFAAFLVNDVVRLLLDVLMVRGTVVITASHQGLTFRNVPAFDHSGFIPRDDVEGLRVALHKAGFRRHVHFLYANLASGKRQTLLTGPDAAALEDARVRLADALGIESPG